MKKIVVQEPPYTKKQLAELLGAKPRTIQFYTEEGLLPTEGDSSTGRGVPRRYPEWAILYFLLVKELTKLRILDLNMIKEIIHVLHGKENIQHQEFIKIINPHLEDKSDFKYEITGDKQECSVEMKDHDVVVVLNITALREKAKALMPQL